MVYSLKKKTYISLKSPFSIKKSFYLSYSISAKKFDFGEKIVYNKRVKRKKFFVFSFADVELDVRRNALLRGAGPPGRLFGLKILISVKLLKNC